MWARMNLIRDPGINFSVLIENAPWTNQAGCVEDVSRPLGIHFEHRSTLDIDVVLASLLLQPFGVFVWNSDGQFFMKFGSRWEYWCRVPKFREDNKTDW